ncbi:16S rRNA (guanine(966)-N(2))-methyltransferase RsmD [Pelagibacteraceae bacterium]|nr:16S rRNA (guanine(966)-N(2))-methyltransferase RsmD [Pelagibacteraceae bacterium]
MRIISGKFKGKSIQFLKTKITRPLKDSVKENIFNILAHSSEIKVNISKANILDLYSGIGSFGLECISRGAEKVTFIDQDINALNVLKKNIHQLTIIDQTTIINNKIENFLSLNVKTKYNIFFLDPPFADVKFIHNLKTIKENRIMMNNHIVIIHREKGIIDNFEGILKPLIIKEYARSKIVFGTFN